MGRGGAKEKPEILPQLKPKNAGEVGEGELQAPRRPTLGKRMREVTAEKRQERVRQKRLPSSAYRRRFSGSCALEKLTWNKQCDQPWKRRWGVALAQEAGAGTQSSDENKSVMVLGGPTEPGPARSDRTGILDGLHYGGDSFPRERRQTKREKYDNSPKSSSTDGPKYSSERRTGKKESALRADRPARHEKGDKQQGRRGDSMGDSKRGMEKLEGKRLEHVIMREKLFNGGENSGRAVQKIGSEERGGNA